MQADLSLPGPIQEVYVLQVLTEHGLLLNLVDLITGEFAVLDCTVRYIFLNCDLISSVVLRESDELLGAT